MPRLYETALGYLVARCAHVMHRSLHAAFDRAAHDMTPEEWGLLSRLHENDGQRQAELADATNRDRTTVTRLLDGMVRKGLVRRVADPADRRAVQTWLTPHGRAMRRKLLPVAESVLRRATRGTSKKDLAVTVATLRKLQDNLTDD